ncbi:MAG TPA: hypothetical protein VFC34_04325 [Puia sp.]|nr:hypothetical protein [Puia sp.]
MNGACSPIEQAFFFPLLNEQYSCSPGFNDQGKVTASQKVFIGTASQIFADVSNPAIVGVSAKYPARQKLYEKK